MFPLAGVQFADHPATPVSIEMPAHPDRVRRHYQPAPAELPSDRFHREIAEARAAGCRCALIAGPDGQAQIIFTSARCHLTGHTMAHVTEIPLAKETLCGSDQAS